ncbi:hypothetical protein [Nocardia beijingensis]|uniref:hypothetical protein n=1 Tax=Nocardia beijingensis TaxID=95162 RepID=UPI0033B4CFF3
MSTQLETGDAAELGVDVRPISFDLAGAVAYTGLSKWRLNQLVQQEKVIVLKEGAKNLFLRESLDRYISSLPMWGEIV